MALISQAARLGLASVTISLPPSLLRIYCNDSKDKNTNATIRDLHFPDMAAVVLKLAELAVISTVPADAIMKRVEEVLAHLTMQMLLV